MTKYMIGYLLEGSVEKYHRGLTNEISREFDVRNLNEYIPPHFTLKSPFETVDIGSIENILERFCEEERSSEIEIRDIGSFNKNIIYLNGEFSPEAIGSFGRLSTKLKSIDWIELGRYDLKTDNFHSTLVRAESSKQFNDIMTFLSNRNPYYKMQLDNITILEKYKQGWEVYRKFEL